MLHSAAVNVSGLRREAEAGELVEGAVFVGVRLADSGAFRQVLVVPGPADSDGRRVEAGHVTYQHVLHSKGHVVSGVDGAVRNI